MLLILRQMLSRKCHLLIPFIAGICVLVSVGESSAQTGRTEIELSGDDWQLWLDTAADWYNDEIFLPPVDVEILPVNAPTVGWESLHSGNLSNSRTVRVPGTVEEYFWGEIGGAETSGGSRSGGDYVGVSWWSRTFTPDLSLDGKTFTIHVEQANLRSEVYINGFLAAYDVIANTPFEFDVTEFVNVGEENHLDVRITDPVGNFTWDDNVLMRWGENLIPAVHGFGGITGGITLQATDDVRISDIYVQNQPDPKRVHIFTTLENRSGTAHQGTLTIAIHEYGDPSSVIWEEDIEAEVRGESSIVELHASVPDAMLWELSDNGTLAQAQLYEAAVTFRSGNIEDSDSRRFGFRWFDVGEDDGDMRFYLNGERVFMLAAMTRGFWPVNGIFATPEMAERDRDTMVELGMNTMLMHRAVGQPPVFTYADESGMMTYQEPAGYRVTSNFRDNIDGPDQQALDLRREKLRRVVIRDRSFPSYMILNLKNEARLPPDEDDERNMKMVHELDPSRIITYNSDRNYDIEYDEILEEDPYKMHMLPFDNTLRYRGWWDHHYWVPFSGYVDENYNSPDHYLRDGPGNPRMPLPQDSLLYHEPSEIVFHGEEGAFGTIVRLQKIKEELDETGADGFRELEHIDWFNAYDQFLDESGFRESYPTVDDLTTSLGRNLHYFQARNIENVRMGNVADAYVMNGWGSGGTRTDVVDMYRNSTADPSILSHYTQPLYVAVKLRNKVMSSGSVPVADLYIVNELALNGPHTLSVAYTGPDGSVLFERDYPVEVSGGEEFGELLVEGVSLPAVDVPGHYRMDAVIKDNNGAEQAFGFDEVFGVNLAGEADHQFRVLVLESDGVLQEFIEQNRMYDVASYGDGSETADIVIIGNHDPDSVSDSLRHVLVQRALNGEKIIVLENADDFADAIDNQLMMRPELHQGENISNFGSGGRLFVNTDPVLTELPQGEGMSWEYQSLYKPNAAVGLNSRVRGLRLHHWNHQAIVALGSQSSKEILTSLGRVPVGNGQIMLSTLNIIPNLTNGDVSSVVAKKLLLNLLDY